MINCSINEVLNGLQEIETRLLNILYILDKSLLLFDFTSHRTSITTRTDNFSSFNSIYKRKDVSYSENTLHIKRTKFLPTDIDSISKPESLKFGTKEDEVDITPSAATTINKDKFPTEDSSVEHPDDYEIFQDDIEFAPADKPFQYPATFKERSIFGDIKDDPNSKDELDHKYDKDDEKALYGNLKEAIPEDESFSAISKYNEPLTHEPSDIEFDMMKWLREHNEQILIYHAKRARKRKRKSPPLKRKQLKLRPESQSELELPHEITPVDKIDEAFVTAANSEDSIIGALVLGYSLRHHKTNKKLVILTSTRFSPKLRDLLANIFDDVVQVPYLDGTDLRIKRPDLSASLTKLECWNLTKYQKCVYLECDTMIVQNCDDLFEMDELTAAPDVGWPDCFNSGVFVYKPSNETYNALITLAREKGSFDGGVQGLLNLHFGKDWITDLKKRLSFVYNVVVGYIYTHVPAFKQFGNMTKIAQFIGHPKPWQAHWNYTEGNFKAECLDPNNHHPFLQQWLDIFREHVYPNLPQICHALAEENSVDTVWNLLQASQSPHLYEKPKEKPLPQTTFEVPPQTYRPPVHDFQASYYSEHIQIEARTESSSPIRSSSQVRLQTPSIAEQSSESCFTFPSWSSSSEFKEPPRESSWISSTHGAGLSFAQLMERTQPNTEPIEPDQQFPLESSQSSSASIVALDQEKSDADRMKEWEEGKVDYLGRDKFENIQRKLDLFIKEKNDEPDSESSSEIWEWQKDEEEAIESMGSPISEMDEPFVEEHITASSIQEETDDIITNPADLPGSMINDFSEMRAWESGKIDYTGRYSSDNIMKRLDYFISQTPKK